MPFGREQPVVQVEKEITFVGKEQVQVLECLGEYKTVKAIFLLQSPHILQNENATGIVQSCMDAGLTFMVAYPQGTLAYF